MRTHHFLFPVLVTSIIITASCDHTTDGKPISSETEDTASIAIAEPMPVFSGDTALLIQDIQSQIQLIDQIENWDTVIEKYVASTEEGSARYFFWNDTLQKIHVEAFGHTGQSTVNYYFMKGDLASIYNVDTRYNRPVHWDSTEMKLNSDTQVFDASKSSVSVWQSYWYNGIHLYNDVIQLPESDTTITQTEETQLKDFDFYMKALEKNTDVQFHNQ
ncbi:MAG: hypothetical protein HWD92_07080 [Flavobacteriia bacterium]|nr:hypothetical protein [Flavobacteriia bacterium]